jgi:hypothetical protein
MPLHFTSDMELEHFVYYLGKWYTRDVNTIIAEAEKKPEGKELDDRLASVRQALLDFQNKVNERAVAHHKWYCEQKGEAAYNSIQIGSSRVTPLVFMKHEINLSTTMQPAFYFGVRLSSFLQCSFFASLPLEHDMFSKKNAPIVHSELKKKP